MQFTVKQLPKSELILTIEVTPARLETYEQEASKNVSEKVDIPGFRKGQAPKAYIISQIGPDAFFQEVLNVALPRSYSQAVKEQNLQVISRPEIKILIRSPLKYEAKVAVLPEIILKNYEKIKLPASPIEITDKEIDEVIEEMRKYRAAYKPIEREIRKGDRVEIDFQGHDEGGAPLDKTKSTNHPLFVGEGSLVPGFEEELVGMKMGGKKKFPLKFPKDFHHEPLRAQTVHFEVEIKRAEEAILPELTEDFVHSVTGEKKPVADFKTAIKADLNKRKLLDERKDRENKLLEKLIKEAKFDVPPMLIEEEIDYMVEDFKRELESRGLKFETYLEKLKKENKDLRKEYLEEAEKRIRVRLIINFLFRNLNIDVTDEEMQVAQQRLISRSPEKERAQISENLARKGEFFLRLHNNLMLEKLFVKFLD